MRRPNFREEKKLWKKGYKVVVGLDEAGRGPLAGPVVAAAVTVNPKYQIRNSKQIPNNNSPNNKHNIVFNVCNLKHWNLFKISDLGFGILKIRDSKKLTEKQRECLYKILTRHPDIGWGIGIVSEKIIDKINILEATKLAMLKAIDNLAVSADFLILDGNFSLNTALPQKSIIKADEKVFSCAAASIIAKVTRDRIMRKEHKKYPEYGFENHKGYPTKAHFANLKKFGLCKIHRKTFRPLRGQEI